MLSGRVVKINRAVGFLLGFLGAEKDAPTR